MLKESNTFAAHVKKAQKVIADLKIAGDAMLATTKLTMSAPLPHIYEETAAGSGAAVSHQVSVGGPAFEPDTVTRLSNEASLQMENGVLVPLKRWLDVHTQLQGRMKEVEALRLEVDSRRHTVMDLSSTVDKLREKLSKANGKDGKIEAHLDETVKKLQHKEGKLSVTVQSFQETEQSLYADLCTLIRDAAWMRHYIATALKAQGNALVGAAASLGENTEPDVHLSVSNLEINGQGGTVAAPSQMLQASSPIAA